MVLITAAICKYVGAAGYAYYVQKSVHLHPKRQTFLSILSSTDLNTISMSDIIRLLPDSVANQIAAGEVIQRPASVVKELVENAVDAGATTIDIVLKDAGRTLIQVIDNGTGMSATDARLAFERHSTSKIKEASDLFGLRTMGFRGEALASIAAIAQLDVRTMLHGESLGTRLAIAGSRVESQTPEVCAPGTNMMVKNLFYNVPARRKFLKKDSVELSNIVHEFERLALVNPDVELSLTHNDSLLHRLGKVPLKQRIGDLFGRQVENQLIPVETSTSIVKISGFIGHPSNARKRNALQYFFVNGRNMRHPYFHKAVMTCYEPLITTEVQPNYFLAFEVDPATIDVNIHPTKNEIKFENEQQIWQILVAAIKEALGRFNIGPALEFNLADSPEIPAMGTGHHVSAPSAGAGASSYNPFRESSSVGRSGDYAWMRDSDMRETKGWDTLYAAPSEGYADLMDDDEAVLKSDIVPQLELDGINDKSGMASMANLQAGGKYLVSYTREGLTIVDQHRAHLKVLYEEYLSRISDGGFPTQTLMFPASVELDASRSIILDSIIDSVESIGFRLKSCGNGLWEIEGIPSVLKEADGSEALTDMLQQVVDGTAGGDDVTAESLTQILALSLARCSAIGHGQVLSIEETEHLLASLFALCDPQYTPDGKKIILTIPFDEIDKRLS